MASPHAAGVAALAVSAHGHKDAKAARGYTLSPASVAALMAASATDHACPAGGVQTAADNGFYGEGIVNALGVVQ